MFTGIITDIGTISAIEKAGDDTHLRIQTAYDTSNIALGASIACNGICLTVTELGADWFAVTASAETAQITTLQDWAHGTTLNLERALRMGDELGGHMVSGHVDGIGQIAAITPSGDSHQLTIRCPAALMPYMAKKGSVTLNGISLTINEVSDETITLMIIPHTWEQTTLGQSAPDERINIEIDLIARYIERIMKASN